MKKNDMQSEEEMLEENLRVSQEVTDVPEQSADAEKIEILESQYKRALADYQNLEKRVGEQRREWIQSANKDLLIRLIPVLDTLILASAHTKDQAVKITIDQFQNMLKLEGVTRIDTEGKNFDPMNMEAVGTTEGKEGKVVQETRAGYLLYDKILRPAQVLVGKESK